MEQQPLLSEPQLPNYSNEPPPSVGYPAPASQNAPPVYKDQPQSVSSVPATQTVILTQQSMYFGPRPIPIRCPNCHHEVVTELSYQSGVLTWLAVLAMFILGFAILVTWFCCCIPFCIKGLKDVTHTCPNCRHVCGVYQRLS